MGLFIKKNNQLVPVGISAEVVDGTDVSDTTAVAADVASGKYFYTADGVKTEGTAETGSRSIEYIIPATRENSWHTYNLEDEGLQTQDLFSNNVIIWLEANQATEFIVWKDSNDDDDFSLLIANGSKFYCTYKVQSNYSDFYFPFIATPTNSSSGYGFIELLPSTSNGNKLRMQGWGGASHGSYNASTGTVYADSYEPYYDLHILFY